MRECEVKNCHAKHHIGGHCRRHYYRFVKYGSTDYRPPDLTQRREAGKIGGPISGPIVGQRKHLQSTLPDDLKKAYGF